MSKHTPKNNKLSDDKKPQIRVSKLNLFSPISYFNTKGNYVTLIIIFFSVFIIHALCKNYPVADSRWSIYTAMSIIREGNTNLDEYEKILERHNNYCIEIVDSHKYSIFPPGVSLIAVPFVFVFDQFEKNFLLIDINNILAAGIPVGIEVFIASFIIALASLIIYLIILLIIKDVKYALLTTFIFAFCTSTWSTASRALWQHGPTMLLLSLALYLYLKRKQYPAIIQFVSIPLAFSYIVRPTNIISLVVFTCLILIENKKYFIYYCAWLLIIIVPFLIFNLNIYHSLLPPYYFPNRLGTNSHFLEALAGNLVSPARGLFVFSPILLFSGYGIFIKIKYKEITRLDYALIIIIILHLIAVSSYPHWWAGHSFGPRFLCDMIPYFLYFLTPCFTETFKMHSIKKTIYCFTFVAAVAFSFFVHYRGATNPLAVSWNVFPVNVDSQPDRIWDWKDMQFLRGLK